MDHLPQRQEIIATALRMNALGINQGSSGNLSCRVAGGFLVTPTSIPYEELAPEDVVAMGFDGSFEGRHRPSSEWRFHRDILQRRADIDAVLHVHSVHATALACHGLGIPAFHYMVAVAGGTTIRCAEYATFGTEELSANALEALEGRSACLLANHGVIALGKSLAHALRLAVEVETLARQYLAARVIGEPHILTDAEMARVLEQMRRMSYGEAPDLDPAADVPRRRGG
jgi:L-fuculose-phosphate aldolase